MRPKKPGDYPIGYGKPPAHTRFLKGVSGNRRGRPPGMPAVRANRLALQEAYRLIAVREGDEVSTLPTIQALMRQLARLAAKGNGPALRMFIKMIQIIEQSLGSRHQKRRTGAGPRQRPRPRASPCGFYGQGGHEGFATGLIICRRSLVCVCVRVDVLNGALIAVPARPRNTAACRRVPSR